MRGGAPSACVCTHFDMRQYPVSARAALNFMALCPMISSHWLLGRIVHTPCSSRNGRMRAYMAAAVSASLRMMRSQLRNGVSVSTRLQGAPGVGRARGVHASVSARLISDAHSSGVNTLSRSRAKKDEYGSARWVVEKSRRVAVIMTAQLLEENRNLAESRPFSTAVIIYTCAG